MDVCVCALAGKHVYYATNIDDDDAIDLLPPPPPRINRAQSSRSVAMTHNHNSFRKLTRKSGAHKCDETLTRVSFMYKRNTTDKREKN